QGTCGGGGQTQCVDGQWVGDADAGRTLEAGRGQSVSRCRSGRPCAGSDCRWNGPCVGGECQQSRGHLLIGSGASRSAMTMPIRALWHVLAVLIVGVFTVACNGPSKPLSSPSSSSSDVVARVGDRSITLAEVDAKWRSMSPAEELQAQEAVYKGRRAALDAIIGDD